VTGQSPTGQPLETENKIVFTPSTGVIPRRCVHNHAGKSSDSACTRRIILKKIVISRTRDCKLQNLGFQRFPFMQKKRRFVCTRHSFFWPGQLGPGYRFGKYRFYVAFCNTIFKISRLACTGDHFIVRGRTNLLTQTAQWLFKSSGSACTTRDFSTKGIVSRARDCHLLGSGILRVPPAEWIRDPRIPRACPQPAQRPSHK